MKEKLTVIGALLLLAILLNAGPLVAADSPIGGGSDLPGTPVPALPVYAVTVSFSPSSQIFNEAGLPGPFSAYATISLHNGGSTAFVTTGCTLKVTWSTGKTVTGTCSIGKITVNPGKTYVGKTNAWAFTFHLGVPLNKSKWVVTVLGTVNSTPKQSQPGTEIIFIDDSVP